MQFEQVTQILFFPNWFRLMDKIFFDHPIRNELRTYDNTQKMATGQ